MDLQGSPFYPVPSQGPTQAHPQMSPFVTVAFGIPRQAASESCIWRTVAGSHYPGKHLYLAGSHYPGETPVTLMPPTLHPKKLAAVIHRKVSLWLQDGPSFLFGESLFQTYVTEIPP